MQIGNKWKYLISKNTKRDLGKHSGQCIRVFISNGKPVQQMEKVSWIFGMRNFSA